jgi:pyrroline-5-carboxylate reductase
VFEIARSYVEAAMGLGFSEQHSTAMVLATMKGTIEMAQQSPQSLVQLRNSVTSKNGTTEAGLDALNGSNELDRLFADTLKSAYERAVELR